MKVRFALLATVVLAVAALAFYLLSREDDRLGTAMDASEPGTFARVEDAEKVTGFRIPTVRDLRGWKLKSITVSPSGIIPGDCEDLGACKDPVGPFVVLEYKPPVEGPRMGIRVVRTSPLGISIMRIVRPYAVSVPGGLAHMGEEIQTHWTELQFLSVKPDIVISGLASVQTDPAKASYSRHDFLEMMRSVR